MAKDIFHDAVITALQNEGKNEKIWIQQNNTECLVADYFTDRGVPKSDIVLGF